MHDTKQTKDQDVVDVAEAAIIDAEKVVGDDKDRVNVNVIVTVFGLTIFGWRRRRNRFQRRAD